MATKRKTVQGNEQPKDDSDAQPSKSIEPAPTLDGLAIRLRQARERKNFSLADLLKKTGISRTALHGYEAGKAKPGAREIKLLSETLEISPNWLIFGTEEPFKKRDGLRSLVKMRGNPAAMIMMSSLALPVLIASFDEDQLEALLVLISTMLEARNKDAYRQVSAYAEVFAELVGSGTPEEMAAFSSAASDPKKMEEIQEKIQERLAHYL